VGRAGNGSGGFLATDVLAPLGADISGAGTRCLHRRATRTAAAACRQQTKAARA